MRRVSKIRQEIKKSNGDDEGIVARKTHSGRRSNENRTPEFVGEIQAIIDNHPSESNKSITSDMEVFEFQVGRT